MAKDFLGQVTFKAPVVADTAATVGLVVRGATSQSATLTEWQNSSAGVLASVSAAGNITAQSVTESVSVQVSSGLTNTLTTSTAWTWVITGTSGHTFKLPSTTTISSGAKFTFYNQSTNPITIQDSSATAITALAGGKNAVVIWNGSTWNLSAFFTDSGASGSGQVVLSNNSGLTRAGLASPYLGNSTWSPVAGGNIDYDGNVATFVPSSAATATTNGGAAVIQSAHVWNLAADRALSGSSTTAQNIFGATGTFTATAATTYLLEAVIFIDNGTGAVSNTAQFAFGGTAAWTAGFIRCMGARTTSLSGLGATTLTSFTTSNGGFLQIGAASTSRYMHATFQGTIRVSTAGTILPTVVYDVATSTVPNVKIGSYWKMTPVGTNTMTTIGAFA